jgi:O-antigen ligase
LNKLTIFGIGALLLLATLLGLGASIESLESIPALGAIVQRFQQQPGTNGDQARLDIVAGGLETWSRSPAFGLGYEAPDSRFENGYLSLACETGTIGLLLYLIFVALVGIRIQAFLRTREGSDTREVGGYLLCVTVFILVHGMGERTHGFQIGTVMSNTWALLVASALAACGESRKWRKPSLKG